MLNVKLEACKALEKQAGGGGGGFGFDRFDRDFGHGRSAKRSRREGVDIESALMRKLFVRNLNANITEEKLREFFTQFGDIEVIQLPMHNDSGKPKGFAFVTFTESASVDNVQAQRPHRMDGNTLETTRYRLFYTMMGDIINPLVY